MFVTGPRYHLHLALKKFAWPICHRSLFCTKDHQRLREGQAERIRALHFRYQMLLSSVEAAREASENLLLDSLDVWETLATTPDDLREILSFTETL